MALIIRCVATLPKLQFWVAEFNGGDAISAAVLFSSVRTIDRSVYCVVGSRQSKNEKLKEILIDRSCTILEDHQIGNGTFSIYQLHHRHHHHLFAKKENSIKHLRRTAVKASRRPRRKTHTYTCPKLHKTTQIYEYI